MTRHAAAAALASIPALALALAAYAPDQAGPAAMAPAARHYDEARLSQPSFKARVELDVRVPLRDGVTSSVDVYRPDAPGRFPVILVRSPYNNNIQRNILQSTFFAERGYVYLYEDVRGRYDAGGQFYPFRHEPDDGVDVIEWITRQPWYNGKLGTRGGSYTGFTQWGPAIRGSRHITAMAPQYTTPDIYGNWIYVDGALNYAFALSWGAVSIDGRGTEPPAALDWTRVYRTLPIAEAPAAAGHKAPHYRDWITNQTRDKAFWDTVSLERLRDRIAAPVLTVGGWYDIFNRGAIEDDRIVRAQARTPEARAGKRLMIGPWIHGGADRRNGDVDFGEAASVDLDRVYLRWFDYWLKGIDNGVMAEPPIKIFVMGENVWRYESEWPLKRARPTRFYLSSGGRANTLDGNGRFSNTPPAADGAGTDTFTYDPENPVPTLGGTSCCAAQTPVGAYDMRPLERRDDVLVYTTEPLAAPVEVTGPVTLTLYAATSARDTDWTARLVDVRPDGYAMNVQEGILRARYRETRGQRPGTLLEPNRVYEYTIDLWSASNVFLPGHRIRLEVSSSNFPHFDRNLNTGDDPATSARIVVARQTIHHSSRYPSHLTLPIVSR